MKRIWLKTVCLCLFASQANAIDTYFPGEGPPTSADVETESPQYYPQQPAQPALSDDQYNNPAAPLNPDEIIPAPTNPVTE